MKEVYLIDGARTAFTSFGGSFKSMSATELGAATANEAMKRSNVKADWIDHVIYGNVIHTSTNASYLSRHIGLKAGVPLDVPSYNVNRLCGSGAQAVVSAAHHILLEEADLVLAGGAENMSMSPLSNFTSRFTPPKYGGLQFEDMLLATLTDEYTGSGMGVTAENLAGKYSISRTEQDEYALLSQERATKSSDNGVFDKEIVAVDIPGKGGGKSVCVDEHIKKGVTYDKLASLTPSFNKEGGTVTAGNASGINDGAASTIIASEKAVKKHELTPFAKIKSWGVVGVDPTIMGIGPVPAIQQALKRADLDLAQIDLFEINEAFAAQYLAVEKELNLDRAKTNVNGGAIALGHPVGASGTRILLSLAYDLARKGLRYGVASLCIGGGQGIAVVIENVRK